MHALRDSLRTLKKGSSIVSEFARKFKGICDELNVIGHSLDENDISHWFFCGLGSPFETFSTTQRLLKPCPTFCDLVSQVESHEPLLQSISDYNVAPVAFVADNIHDSFHHPPTRALVVVRSLMSS
ncbi:zinc finger, CCHC-type containing LTR copia-type gag-polypeptide [Tanacetum coccineum]|uniref:Zinc finger, CCHC-type containing LTR copia-type gag-polypeptide n=1 Tax=Tanacetum coccineum TaxID=301880 RepID=A0ABQ5E714_9ASTR